MELVRALPVEGVENVEPSGLTLLDGELYTVDDTRDGVVFRLRLEEERAVLEPHVEFVPPPLEGIGRFDFEGITHDPDGRFYLVSEDAARILRVTPDGEAAWMIPSLEAAGRRVGLLQDEDAWFEGIARLRGDTFALVAEREPRGIVETTLGDDPYVRAFRADSSRIPYPRSRSLDFAGAYARGDTLWVLERGAHAVCRIAREPDHRVEEACWSYASVENDPRYRYASMDFGRGEGLVVDDERVIVVLDNNDDRRASDPDDRRPLVFILRRP